MSGTTLGRWEITIPGWCPTPLNGLLRGRGALSCRKRRDRDYVTLFARLARIPRAEGRRRLSSSITLPPGHRRWDGVAFHKSLLNACVHAGLLKGDSPRWCEVGTVACARGGALETVLIIEALS
jgi:hypothetical protein